MRFLYIYTKINGSHVDTFAFGLASVMSYAKNLGHEIRFGMVKTKSEYENVYKFVKKFDPIVIGFNSVLSQFAAVKEIAASNRYIAKRISYAFKMPGLCLARNSRPDSISK